MEITEIATPFERVFDPPARGGGDARGDFAALAFYTAYGDDLFSFIEECGGKVEDTGAGVSVRVPLRFPDTKKADFYAERYSWRGIGGRDALPVIAEPTPPAPGDVPYAPGPPGTGWNATHRRAEVTIEFRKPGFNFQDSVFLSRRNRIGARVVTVPGAPYRYAVTASGGAGLPINQDVGIVVPTQELRITRHWAPDLAAIEAAVIPLIFNTNSANLTIGTQVYPPGTVLFGGFDSDETRGGFGGVLTNRIDYSLLVDLAGWDRVMSDITAQFEPVTPSIYPRDDLSVLWTL